MTLDRLSLLPVDVDVIGMALQLNIFILVLLFSRDNDLDRRFLLIFPNNLVAIVAAGLWDRYPDPGSDENVLRCILFETG